MIQTGSGVHPTSYLMGTRVISPGVKRPGREADHSPLASAKVKKCGSIHPLPHAPSWRSVYLVKLNSMYQTVRNLAHHKEKFYNLYDVIWKQFGLNCLQVMAIKWVSGSHSASGNSWLSGDHPSCMRGEHLYVQIVEHKDTAPPPPPMREQNMS
jgi:hypothetical protein